MTRTRKLERKRFDETVDIVRLRFPTLHLAIDHDDPHVDARLEIPRQPGLDFDVSINLQNLDELHINAGALWVEWFPCGDQQVFNQFIEATTGLLSGSHRIVEYHGAGAPAKAELQRPTGSGRQKIAVWSNLRTLLPFRRMPHVLQNKHAA